MNKHSWNTAWPLAAFAPLIALGLLTACPKEKPAAAPAAKLPPGVTSERQAPAGGGVTGLPAGVDEADPAVAKAANQGVIGGHLTQAVLDSRGRLGGPYPNSTLAVFSPMLYNTALERLSDIKLLQELLDNGSAVFIPNGTQVEYSFETQFDKSFIAITYDGKRWYVKGEDATLEAAK